MPARVLLQDFTGVPAVVDLAVMRDAMADLGGDPAKVNPLVPADLVIDHSVQIDRFGTPGAFAFNVEREYERNGERYQLLRWAQTAFRDLRVVPPGTGIIHQVNLEFLATVVDRPRRRRRRPGRLPRHARRDRFAHDDGQRPRRPRLRRRRHRGRGRPARPAALPADAARRRRPAPRRAAARLDRDRPGPGRDRDAARARRRRLVRRVRRRRPGHPGPGRPDDDQQHEPRVRGDRDALPDRRRDDRLPAPDRPLAGAGRARRALRQGAGPVAACPATGRSSTSCSSSTSPASSRRSRGRAGRRTGSSCPGSRPTSEAAFPVSRRPSRGRQGGPRPADRRGRHDRCHRQRQRGDRGRRPARDRPARLGGDRGDHVVHEHLEPDGHGRGRAAGPQRGRPRPAGRADGQDLAGAGLARRDRLSRGGRADGPARDARASRWPATAARPASATPARSTRRSPPRSRRTTWSSPPSCRATATSRAGSTRSRGPATSPRRRWSSPSPWPAGSTST